ncbi:MAG: [Fe-Fe] hydrogenase large subunit C-terminal domain-containing protein [Christensenellales bacterium]|jgi:Fe-S-cluster-containing hydrogenase component 2
MNRYFHSVRLLDEQCKGCTNCLKTCPTEAIRVRGGKARIKGERCIDCGQCIKVCPHGAKIAVTDSVKMLSAFEYNIALPPPALYGQFAGLNDTRILIAALEKIGFNEVYEVAKGAEIASMTSQIIMEKSIIDRPVISSACPAVVRLIQVKYPSLLPHVMTIDPPVEIAAQLAREEAAAKTGLPQEKIGVFFITPCPAKMTGIKNPIGRIKSSISGAISMSDIYGLLSRNLSSITEDDIEDISVASGLGVSWATSGGEAAAMGVASNLCVDGIDNVSRVLEELENNNFTGLEFFEGLACTAGCVGGPLVFENNYVAKNRIRQLAENLKTTGVRPDVHQLADIERWRFDEPVAQRPVLKLDDDVEKAMEKMDRIEKLCGLLPGLDCGSCGSPSCRALAEDIVQGNASQLDCIFILKDKIQQLAHEMAQFAGLDYMKQNGG